MWCEGWESLALGTVLCYRCLRMSSEFGRFPVRLRGVFLAGLCSALLTMAAQYGQASGWGGGFVWEATLVRPLLEPPLDVELTLANYIRICNDLNTDLTKIAGEGSSLELSRIYLSPVSQSSARLILISTEPLGEADRKKLELLKERA